MKSFIEFRERSLMGWCTLAVPNGRTNLRGSASIDKGPRIMVFCFTAYTLFDTWCSIADVVEVGSCGVYIERWVRKCEVSCLFELLASLCLAIVFFSPGFIAYSSLKY